MVDYLDLSIAGVVLMVTLFKREAMALGYQVKLRFRIDQKDSLETLSFIKDQWNNDIK